MSKLVPDSINCVQEKIRKLPFPLNEVNLCTKVMDNLAFYRNSLSLEQFDLQCKILIRLEQINPFFRVKH